jgi:hypothetical protein
MTIEGLLTLRVGLVNGDDVSSPVWNALWKDGILTSSCKNGCESGHPKKGCSCGIYSVFHNGLEELNNYVSSQYHVVFIGWALSTTHMYTWGVRSGQWVAVGVVNWHGMNIEPINPFAKREPWWDSAYSALDVLRTRKVDNAKLYDLQAALNAIKNQKALLEQRNDVINQLFGVMK